MGTIPVDKETFYTLQSRTEIAEADLAEAIRIIKEHPPLFTLQFGDTGYTLQYQEEQTRRTAFLIRMERRK